MQLEDFPSSTARRLERLKQWLWGRKWRRWLILYLLAMALTALFLLAWIGTAYLIGSTDRDAGWVAFNTVITSTISTLGLALLHKGMLRRFRQSSDLVSPRTPLPRIDWPWALRVRHALLYAFGMASLLYVFFPSGNQRAFGRFIQQFSAGSSSAGSLAMLTFGLLPMAGLSILAMAILHRQMKRRDKGLLDDRAKILLEAETNWLFSFAAALVSASLLCYFAGNMALAKL